MIYLLCFERKISDHAQHYIGWTPDACLEERIAEHIAGRGARITQVAVERGIGMTLVRTWPGDRKRERKLKNFHKATALCPACRAEVNRKRRERYGRKAADLGLPQLPEGPPPDAGGDEVWLPF